MQILGPKDKTPFGILRPSAMCDECGDEYDQYQIRPFRKSNVHDEALLCAKCIKKCKDDKPMRIYVKLDARIAETRRIQEERYKRNKLNARRRELTLMK